MNSVESSCCCQAHAQDPEVDHAARPAHPERPAVSFHEHLAAQTIANDERPPGPATSDVSMIEGLNATQARLGDEVRALHDELLRANDRAAQLFDIMVRMVFEHLSIEFTGLLAGGSQRPRRGRGELMQHSLQATVSELSVQLAGGDLSVRHVRVSFQGRFEQRLGRFDPLVLDLNRNGLFDVTTPREGHRFDVAGTGQTVRAATATQGDGFLVLDRNHNGQIDDGRELFGDQHGAPNGFAELARFDANHDERIDALDPVFGELAVFEDRNRNGRTDAGELRRLAELHIARIGLERQPSRELANGNPVDWVGTFAHDDGSQGRLGDLRLNYVT